MFPLQFPCKHVIHCTTSVQKVLQQHMSQHGSLNYVYSHHSAHDVEMQVLTCSWRERQFPDMSARSSLLGDPATKMPLQCQRTHLIVIFHVSEVVC